MKKKLLACLITAATLTASAFAFSGCKRPDENNPTGNEPPHDTHTYDKQVAESKYLVSEATVTDKAVYHYSCECGEAGTETFEYGELLQPSAGLEYTLNSDGKGYSVTSIDKATDTDIIIAGEIDGKPVTAIGDFAFSGCGELTSVTIPKYVTSIGRYAFELCSELTSVTLPDGVNSIADHAFYCCTKLTSVTIPDSVTSIDSHAFGDCLNLTSIIFKGTKEQWLAIEKNIYWCIRTDVKITCADGTKLDRNGNIVTN